MNRDSNYQNKAMDPVERAKEEGIDLTLLYENLRRTPTERIEKWENIYEFVEELRRAGAQKHVKG